MYMLDDGLIYSARYATSLETSRVPAVLLVSFDGTPIGVETQDGCFQSDALLVRSRLPRKLKAWNNRFVGIHIDPAHPCYASVNAATGDAGVVKVSAASYLSCLEPFATKDPSEIGLADADAMFCEVVGCLTEEIGCSDVQDPRISRILDQMNAVSPLDYDYGQLLKLSGLSSGRLSHLFTDEVGISLRSFKAWRKIREAISLLSTNSDLTSVAHLSGFSDSAHFSRSFVSSFGLVPSMFRDGRCVQVLADEVL
ncbi:MAG: AraC family transcriptional regulator [Pseudomonadota bacterium]